jgi:hypothetical protein
MTVNKSQRTVNGDFKKGFSGNPKGRPKGAKDKISHNIKENFEAVFEKLGGSEGFLEWAKKNTNTQSAFYQMYSKMLPANVAMEHSGKIDSKLIIEIVKVKSRDENNSK